MSNTFKFFGINEYGTRKMSKKSPSARVTLIYKNLTLVNISVKIQEARKMSKKSSLRRITFDVSVTHRALDRKMER